MWKFSRMERSTACRAACSRSQALASFVPINRPQSASTSWFASDRAFRSASRAFRADSRAFCADTKAARFGSRATKDSHNATSVFARDVRNPTSVSAWQAFASSSPCSAAVARSAAHCPSTHAVVTSAT